MNWKQQEYWPSCFLYFTRSDDMGSLTKRSTSSRCVVFKSLIRLLSSLICSFNCQSSVYGDILWNFIDEKSFVMIRNFTELHRCFIQSLRVVRCIKVCISSNLPIRVFSTRTMSDNLKELDFTWNPLFVHKLLLPPRQGNFYIPSLVEFVILDIFRSVNDK